MASERQVLTFHTKAWSSFAPPACRMPLGQPSGYPRTDPGRWSSPRFRHRLIRFRHFISGSLTLASLDPTCRDLVPTFLQRSPPSLFTTAACSGLEPAPDCRLRGTYPHLSYSIAPPSSVGAFVTHRPRRTFAVAQRTPQFGARMPVVGAVHCIEEELSRMTNCQNNY